MRKYKVIGTDKRFDEADPFAKYHPTFVESMIEGEPAWRLTAPNKEGVVGVKVYGSVRMRGILKNNILYLPSFGETLEDVRKSITVQAK